MGQTGDARPDPQPPVGVPAGGFVFGGGSRVDGRGLFLRAPSAVDQSESQRCKSIYEKFQKHFELPDLSIGPGVEDSSWEPPLFRLRRFAPECRHFFQEIAVCFRVLLLVARPGSTDLPGLVSIAITRRCPMSRNRVRRCNSMVLVDFS